MLDRRKLRHGTFLPPPPGGIPGAIGSPVWTREASWAITTKIRDAVIETDLHPCYVQNVSQIRPAVSEEMRPEQTD